MTIPSPLVFALSLCLSLIKRDPNTVFVDDGGLGRVFWVGAQRNVVIGSPLLTSATSRTNALPAKTKVEVIRGA